MHEECIACTRVLLCRRVRPSLVFFFPVIVCSERLVMVLTPRLDLVCQKARIMIHESSNNTTYAPSESSAGRTSRDSKNTALSNIDAMQLQNVLLKNKELEEVVSGYASVSQLWYLSNFDS